MSERIPIEPISPKQTENLCLAEQELVLLKVDLDGSIIISPMGGPASTTHIYFNEMTISVDNETLLKVGRFHDQVVWASLHPSDSNGPIHESIILSSSRNGQKEVFQLTLNSTEAP